MMHRISWVLLATAFCLPLASCDINIPFPADRPSTTDAKPQQQPSESTEATHPATFSWMSLYLPWADSSATFAGLRNYHTKESEERPFKLEQLHDYALYCTLGSNWEGLYATLRITSDGVATAAYQDYTTRRFYQKTFRLTPDQLQKLNRCLLENQIGALGDSYADLKAENGTQGGITLVADGRVRRTYFSNAWPDSIRNLFSFLNSEILRYNPSLRNNDFQAAAKTILQTDPESTRAARGLVRGGKTSPSPLAKSNGK